MENIAFFTLIIVIVFGVLQIILFFKIWGMTNDVRKIKNKTVNSFNEAHKQIILGNKDRAFEIYQRLYVEELIKISELKLDFEENYPKLVEKYKYELSKLGEGYSIDFSEYDAINKIRKVTE